MSEDTIFVTGATGFIGSILCSYLKLNGKDVRCGVRTIINTQHLSDMLNVFEVGEINSSTSWKAGLKGVHAVVHLASRVHIMRESAQHSLAAFRCVNVEGTLNLARQAADAGVKRFIFLSSVKVNGEITDLGHPYTELDPPAPLDSYGVSKLEAEVGLRRLGVETGMEVIIIRSPLVYGPGVKANFKSMINWVKIGIPLPLAAIHNKRSFVGIDNLIDLIHICLDHSAAANQVFFVADGEDLSTPDLLRRVGIAIGKPVRLYPVPLVLFKFTSSLFGKRALARRLYGSLQVDISKAHELLQWIPPVSVNEGLKKVVKEFH